MAGPPRLWALCSTGAPLPAASGRMSLGIPYGFCLPFSSSSAWPALGCSSPHVGPCLPSRPSLA
eukprot:6614254-Lingulodinium_polyedra.AAC.1